MHSSRFFFIHGKRYRETSYLGSILHQNLGLVSVVAKGIFSSKSSINLDPFALYHAKISGNNNLKTIYNVELESVLLDSSSLDASHLLQLLGTHEILHLLAKSHFEETNTLFPFYMNLLKNPSDLYLCALLYDQMLQSIGIHYNFDYESYSKDRISINKLYSFSPKSGFIENSAGIPGSVIHGIKNKQFEDKKIRKAFFKIALKSLEDFFDQSLFKSLKDLKQFLAED